MKIAEARRIMKHAIRSKRAVGVGYEMRRHAWCGEGIMHCLNVLQLGNEGRGGWTW